MKRTALERKAPPSGSASGLRRSQPKRDWSAAREKVDGEGECRIGSGCGLYPKLEAAHIIKRSRDRWLSLMEDHMALVFPMPRESKVWKVCPSRIVPLCTKHHRAYDAHEIDLLPVLTLDEQVQAVIDADGLENARRRLCPSEYRSST